MLEPENIPRLRLCLIERNVHLFLSLELFSSLINNMDNVLRECLFNFLAAYGLDRLQVCYERRLKLKS